MRKRDGKEIARETDTRGKGAEIGRDRRWTDNNISKRKKKRREWQTRRNKDKQGNGRKRRGRDAAKGSNKHILEIDKFQPHSRQPYPAWLAYERKDVTTIEIQEVLTERKKVKA